MVSRSVLEKLGRIPKHFPRVGEFLDYEDKALTGKLFSINPYTTGWVSGEFHPELISNHPPVIRPAREEKTEGVVSRLHRDTSQTYLPKMGVLIVVNPVDPPRQILPLTSVTRV